MQVAQVAVRAVLQSSGQNCAGAERFYIHNDIYNSFVSEVTKIVKSVSAVSIFNEIFIVCYVFISIIILDLLIRPILLREL